MPTLQAFAQQPEVPSEPARVVVSGEQTDSDARRDFVAGKIIISRQRIADSGAENVAELLKREPSVSVSSDGRIGLLGLPGYTQVLVDGAPPDSGRGLHQLNLVHVDKIEIIKSSIAEYGPFGIAGTINIITRKAARKTSTEFGVGASATGSEPGVSATLSHNESRDGSPLRLSGSLSAGHSRSASESGLRLSSRMPRQAELDIWEGSANARGHSSDANASGELAWDSGAGQALRLSPNGGQSSSRSLAVEQRRYANGNDTRSSIATRSVLDMANLPINWTVKPDKRSQLEMRARLSRIRLDIVEDRVDAGDGPSAVREFSQEAESRVRQLELNYKTRLAKGHDIKLGASTLQTREAIDYGNRIDGRADPAFDFLGTHRAALSRQTRLFAQDDWRVSDTLALNAGLSGQQTTIGLHEGAFDSSAHFRLWSPSVHVLKNLGGDDTRQLRLSIARTYRAPDRNDLALRPRINSLAPCTLRACGENTIDTLDSAGNPVLRPERSLGLNLSYEHGMGDNSTLTVEVYTRSIGGKIGTEITREAVPWSIFPRYVSRPANLGNASVQGVNLEMDLALRDLSKLAPKMNLRGNINLAGSRVSSLRGPDNRLDKQTPWSAKLGGSYALPGWPLKLDLDANWSPGVWIRSNQSQRIRVARRFDLDGGVSWTIAPGKRLRLSVNDLVPRSAQSVYEYETAEGLFDLRTDTRKYRTLTLRFDTKV